MPEGIGLNEILALPAGALITFFAVKVIWPIIKQTLDGARIRGEAENQGYIRLKDERDLYMKRAELAEERADQLFEALQKVRSDLAILTAKFDMATERINALTAKINSYRGVDE